VSIEANDELVTEAIESGSSSEEMLLRGQESLQTAQPHRVA